MLLCFELKGMHTELNLLLNSYAINFVTLTFVMLTYVMLTCVMLTCVMLTHVMLATDSRSQSSVSSLMAGSLHRLHTSSPQLRSSPLCFQSPGSVLSYSEMSMNGDSLDPLQPEICLDHLWTESASVSQYVQCTCVSQYVLCTCVSQYVLCTCVSQYLLCTCV